MSTQTTAAQGDQKGLSYLPSLQKGAVMLQLPWSLQETTHTAVWRSTYLENPMKSLLSGAHYTKSQWDPQDFQSLSGQVSASSIPASPRIINSGGRTLGSIVLCPCSPDQGHCAFCSVPIYSLSTQTYCSDRETGISHSNKWQESSSSYVGPQRYWSQSQERLSGLQQRRVQKKRQPPARVHWTLRWMSTARRLQRAVSHFCFLKIRIYWDCPAL